MRLLHVTHPSGYRHDTGLLHPERPARLRAAKAGVEVSGVPATEVEAVALNPADLTVVHDQAYVEAVRRFCAAGGGNLDPDTVASAASWEAALTAAGAGPTAVEFLSGGWDGPALVTVRPPGHHALADRAMGFCLFNNVAVTAARLRQGGARIAIVDWDVHHGNGTQAIFYHDPDVLYVSLHQSPFYPFEGDVTEIGAAEGEGATVNLPLPAYTAGDVYRAAFSEIVAPVLAAFAPHWVLVSAGYDAHAHDPLAEMRLVESDYYTLASSLLAFVPPRRIIVFLEGGYHLPAIRDSVAATIQGLAGTSPVLEPSPHRSPEAAWRQLDRLRRALSGRVVGLA